MTKNTFNKTIDLIYNCGVNIEKLLNQLADLEIKEKINSEEYINTLKQIDMVKNVLDESLEKTDLSIKDGFRLKDILVNEMNIFNDGDCILNIIVNGSDENSFLFLYSVLYDYYLQKKDTNLDDDSILDTLEQNDIDDFDDDFDDEDYEENNETESIDIQEYIKEYQHIEADILNIKGIYEINILYNLLIDKIKNETNKKVKEELIKIKYKIIFTNPILLDRLLNNPDKIYSTTIAKKILENYQYNENPDIQSTFDITYSNTLLYTLEEWIELLSDIDETQIEDIQYKTWITMMMLFMKTNISIINDEYQKSIIYVLKRKAISEANSDLSKQIFNEAFAKTL